MNKQGAIKAGLLVLVLALLTRLGAESVGEYLMMGKPRGHFGLYFQNMTERRTNFADVNVSLGYDTPTNSSGVSFGGSMWLAMRMYEYARGDFDSTKDNFIFTEAYAKFERNDRIKVQAGRFYTTAEWVQFYNQGAHVQYALNQNAAVRLLWINANAYVTNYRMSEYRNPFGKSGVFFGDLLLSLPASPIKISPYFYIAPNRFSAFGIKLMLEKPTLGDSTLYANVHLLSYIGRNEIIESSRTDGDGALVWVEGGVKWSGVKFGGGFMSVSKNGISGIDAFGQSSPFERREGLFYADANTLYGVLEYTFENHLVLESAIRNTSIGSKYIFNWEANARITIAPDMVFGGGFIGMFNNANIMLDDYIFASDGRNYVLGRVFLQFKF